ncbi:hypothetical protein ACWEN6_13485 [Sphaerisporangium sp. NPDC004334]
MAQQMQVSQQAIIDGLRHRHAAEVERLTYEIVLLSAAVDDLQRRLTEQQGGQDA